MTKEEAESTEKMAFNQGFYNLFLLLRVFVMLLSRWLTGEIHSGKALVVFAACQ